MPNAILATYHYIPQISKSRFVCFFMHIEKFHSTTWMGVYIPLLPFLQPAVVRFQQTSPQYLISKERKLFWPASLLIYYRQRCLQYDSRCIQRISSSLCYYVAVKQNEYISQASDCKKKFKEVFYKMHQHNPLFLEVLQHLFVYECTNSTFGTIREVSTHAHTGRDKNGQLSKQPCEPY